MRDVGLTADLADSSTQAALLAGCAMSAISGKSIDSFDDEATGIVEKARHQFGTAVHVSAGAAALASSLWVTFISSHLIARTRDAVIAIGIPTSHSMETWRRR